MIKIISILVLVVALANEIAGHGRMMDPVNRASRWRVGMGGPADYNDMEGFCGGFNTQWSTYGGKCGYCGDSYGDATPRRHELGGLYGDGTIVKTYKRGATIPITVTITANHRGYFYFKICNLDQDQRESDGCFDRYQVLISDGSSTYTLPSTESKDYTLSIKLPSDLVCNHCVLQWTYVAGNNWGVCPDGPGRVGCGPQEHFRNCADISIRN